MNKEITLEDYREFCSEQKDCDKCPLKGDTLSGIYENCLGYVTEHAAEADSAIQEWKEELEQEKIAKRQSLFIIYDKYFAETIYGVASSYAIAEKMVKKLGEEALADILAVDSEDSGIHWGSMTKEQQEEFYNTQIKSAFIIKEMKLDCYTYDEEVHAI